MEKVKDEFKLVVCKFFSPYSDWTWYVTEGSRNDDGDFIFFGLVCGFTKEWGYFSLRELESLTTGAFSLVERDLYFTPATIKELKLIT